jgi:ribose 5-phosphate isomerase A
MQDAWKRAAAARAVELVWPGIVVGLGAGSTAQMAIERIAALLASGRLAGVRGVPCSAAAGRCAAQLGIPLTNLEDHPVIDITIDGADEVDASLTLIKGGGGALLHEKIVAQASRREVIIADATKMSACVGTLRALPVEVVPFGWRSQAAYLESLGARVRLRCAPDGTPFRTDEGNLILDCELGPIRDPSALSRALGERAGIVEHGLFLGLATDVLIAGDDGIRHLTRDPPMDVAR